MIYIDIDGVLTNLAATLSKLLNVDLKILKYYDFKNLPYREDIFKIFNDTELMDDYCLNSVPNFAVIEALKKTNANFEFLTARPETCRRATQEWLNNVGLDDINLIHNKDKNGIMTRGDILIDDCPKNINSLKNGRIGYCFSNEQNQYFEEYEFYNIINFVYENNLLELLNSYKESDLITNVYRLNQLNPAKRTTQIVFLKLTEEMGELASALQQYLGHNKKRQK